MAEGIHAKRNWQEQVVLLLARGFGSGLAPTAPGTAGTLVGVALYLLLRPLDLVWYAALLGGGSLAGIYLCGKAAELLGGKDHPGIVWDEMMGFCMTMTAVPADWYWIPAGFVLFRAFDILKPWPISWLDRRVEGGLGIMLDDLAAGAAACALLQVSAFTVHHWWGSA